MFLDEILPDMKWFGDREGAVFFTFWVVNEPQAEPVMRGPYSVTSTTRRIKIRVRAREVATRIEWAARSGYTARLGSPLMRIAPAGKAP